MKTDVLPQHGFVELVSHKASDLDVVNAARVSMDNESDWEVSPGLNAEVGQPAYSGVLSKADEGLIKYLMRNRHGTPFEQNFFKFRVKAPIFVFREWHRHRIGISINEQSGRYSELEREFYVPALEQMRSQTGSPGHYVFEPMDAEMAQMTRQHIIEASNYAFDAYRSALDVKVAKEIARLVLPVNTYSTMIWTCNARSLMAFLSLRKHVHAQWEIQQYANAMADMFKTIMPVTAENFLSGPVDDSGRLVAP